MCLQIQRYFCAVQGYAGKADLTLRAFGTQKENLGQLTIPTCISEIIKRILELF